MNEVKNTVNYRHREKQWTNDKWRETGCGMRMVNNNNMSGMMEIADLFTQDSSPRVKSKKTHKKGQHLNKQWAMELDTHQTIPCAPDPIGFRF